jgi:hypothetical protein
LHSLFHVSELERGDTTPRMEASCAPVLDHYASVIHAFEFAQSSASPLNGDDENLLTYPAIGYLLLGHNRPPCSRGVSLHLLPYTALLCPSEAILAALAGGSMRDPASELRLLGVLGSSLSSSVARRRLRDRHEAPEHCVADAPLETPQRLLARFALRDLLAVIDSASSVRPGLAGGDHVQSALLSLRLPANESLWRTTSPLDASSGAVPA